MKMMALLLLSMLLDYVAMLMLLSPLLICSMNIGVLAAMISVTITITTTIDEEDDDIKS